MKPLIVIVTFLIGHVACCGQTRELDSLVSNLQNFRENDSIRAQLLYDVAVKMRRLDPASAIQYYERSYEVAGIALQPRLQGKATQGIAICNGMLGNYPEAVAFFQRTIELARKHSDYVRIADAYNGLGVVYKRLGDYPQSLAYYSQALEVYDSLGDELGIAGTNDNLGILYDLMKEPDKSMEYYRRAIDVYTKAGQPLQTLTSRFNMAVLFVGQKRYQEALEAFQMLRRKYDSTGNVSQSMHCAINLGHIYRMQGRHDEAVGILSRALADAQKLSMKEEQVNIYDNLLNLALDKNQTGVALSYALTYQDLAEELGAKSFRATGYSLLAKVYEKEKDYRKALEAFKTYKAWRDSVYNEDNARAFKAQEVKVEVLEKNRQLAEQELELRFLEESVRHERTLKWLLVVVSVLLFAVGVLFFQKFSERRRVNELLTEKNTEISRQKAHIEEMNYHLENRMLRAQINPHFIFNSLGLVQHLITRGDKRTALQYLAKFSHLLRQVLESSITGNVVLKDEIRLLEMYLELEALRFDNGFTWSVHVEDSLNVELVEIPTMILQPLMENAILHGLLPKSDDRRLSISFAENDGLLQIVIADNGIGRAASKEIQDKKRKINPSRGLSVTEQRLTALGKKYGWQTELAYIDSIDEAGRPAGTSVVIKLPSLGIS